MLASLETCTTAALESGATESAIYEEAFSPPGVIAGRKSPRKTNKIPHRGTGAEVVLGRIPAQNHDSALVIVSFTESKNYTQSFEDLGGGWGIYFFGGTGRAGSCQLEDALASD
jgi:hypothetical protein